MRQEFQLAMNERLRNVRGRAARRGRSLGFTLLELVIVITIIMILLTLAAGQYQRSVRRTKEAVLKQNLVVLREAIDQYTLDKQAATGSLEELVAAGYLRAVPADPITTRKDWRLDYEDVALSPEQVGTGITNVHSASDLIALDGTPYADW